MTRRRVFSVSRQTLYNWLFGRRQPAPEAAAARRAARVFSALGFKPSLALDRTITRGKSLLQLLGENDGRDAASCVSSGAAMRPGLSWMKSWAAAKPVWRPPTTGTIPGRGRLTPMEEGQPQWSRKTPWRQGHVLCAKARAATGLSHADADATCVVVISHDCDVANDDLI